MPTLMPDKCLTKLIFTQEKSITCTSGGLGYQYWRPNNVFDIDSSIGGPACSGYAEWTTLYSQYRCRAVKAYVYLCSSSTNAVSSAIMAVTIPLPEDDLATLTSNLDSDKWASTRYAKTRLLTTFQEVKPIKQYFSCPKIFGLTKTQYDAEQDFSAFTSNNLPLANQLYHLVGVQPIDKAASLTVYCHVKYVCYTEFFSPQNTICTV